jgi:uracil-DNA glycosylase
VAVQVTEALVLRLVRIVMSVDVGVRLMGSNRLRLRLFLSLVLGGSLVGCAADTSSSSSSGGSENGAAVEADEQELRRCGAPSGPKSTAAADRLWARVPAAWQTLLASEREADYFPRLANFVEKARAKSKPVYPSAEDTFNALAMAPPDQVRVVILGQDPYFNPGQAQGLAFSVKPPTKPPPSLSNIFKELESDIPDTTPVEHGSLVAWAKQGVLLLNAILTVEDGTPASHQCQGWEIFSDAIITKLSADPGKLVFVLWGQYAQSKIPLIDSRHAIITGAHPSPLSARKFLGSKPFSQVNAALANQRKRQVDWQLPATAE